MKFNAPSESTLSLVAKQTAAAAANPALLEGMTKLEKIAYWLNAPRYKTTQLDSWVTYPTEGEYSGKAHLVVPGEAIHGVNSGLVRVYLGHPKTDSLGRWLVKVCMSYIPVNGECKLLVPGEKSKVSWTNIESNLVTIEELFDLGCLDSSVIDRVSAWVFANIGVGAQLPLCVNGFEAIFKANNVGSNPMRYGGRNAHLSAGEETGLGFDRFLFQDAKLLAHTSSVMGASKTTKVYSANMTQLYLQKVAATNAMANDDLI